MDLKKLGMWASNWNGIESRVRVWKLGEMQSWIQVKDTQIWEMGQWERERKRGAVRELKDERNHIFAAFATKCHLTVNEVDSSKLKMSFLTGRVG